MKLISLESKSYKLVLYPSQSQNPSVIQEQEILEELTILLSESQWVAIDTEADSLHAYPEKLCLIQISISGQDLLLDPLAELDLKPFFTVLKEHELIMHGADYDLRLFRKHHDFVPTEIFDTMLASRLIGVQSFGLSTLVEAFLGIKLEKGSQKADWARRPLTAQMEEYARNDTRYLKPLRDILHEKLKSLGRLSWQIQSCQRLIEDASVPSIPDPDEVWRIRGSSGLSRLSLAVLRELYIWREAEARKRNRPPYFVLSHELVIELAELAGHQLEWRKKLPHKMRPQLKRKIVQSIDKALQLPMAEWPHPKRIFLHRPTESEKKRFLELKAIRDKKAAELQLDPTLLASKSELAELARDLQTAAPKLMQWQRDLLLA
jgi:ribonuclease D